MTAPMCNSIRRDKKKTRIVLFLFCISEGLEGIRDKCVSICHWKKRRRGYCKNIKKLDVSIHIGRLKFFYL